MDLAAIRGIEIGDRSGLIGWLVGYDFNELILNVTSEMNRFWWAANIRPTLTWSKHGYPAT